MRIAMVSQHAPEREGRASDRVLYALGTGLTAEGHDLRVWSWRPEPPNEALPPWCTWRPLPPEPTWRTKGRALVRPRSDIVAARWIPPGDADVVIADGPLSYPAVAAARRTVLLVQYQVALDVRALRRWTASDVQDQRAERRDVRRAGLTLTFSDRVLAGRSSGIVPIGIDLGDRTLPPVDEPVAACLADWRWPPNQAAFDVLARAWAMVRAERPDAEIHLAGRGLDRMVPFPGLVSLGVVERSSDVLARAAAVVFPCPPSSGPKMKVLEALGLGRPVVTTPAGAEGVTPAAMDGVELTDDSPAGVARATLALLGSPDRGRERALRAQAAVRAVHGPRPAAAAVVDQVVRRWPELGGP